MKRKVLYLINSLAQGGAERQMAELVRRLPRDRFEPVLCLLDPTNAYPHLLPPDQPRYVIGGPVGPLLAMRLLAILRQERPDIVHSFMEYSNLWARLLGPLAGSNPVVISSVRSRMMRPDYRLVEAMLSRRCHAVVVNSVGTRDELIRWQRVPPQKVHIVRNIVDFQRFRPPTPGERANARAALRVSGTVFLVPGRLSIAKHQIGLVLAVRLALQQGYLRRGEFVVLLAGRVYDSFVSRVVAAEIRALGLGECFRYLGPVRAVEDLYAAADWVLLPSLYEGLPNAALEAHACGLPLLMSHAANLDAIAEPDGTGYEFPTGRIEPLARALGRAAETPEAVRVSMGMAGRERVLARFDPNAALQDILSLYETLLSEQRRGDRA